MDKKTAISLIEDTFNTKFDENKFELFAKNFLNDLEPRNNIYAGQYLWDDQKEHINSYKRIGKYTDPNGDALDVLIVEVKSVSKLEKARTALRNLVIKHLNKFEKDYALVAFHSKEDGGLDWRFSFIKLEHQSYLDEKKGKVKIRKEFTPAKRFSFLVGENEKAYTAKNQLLPQLQNITNNPTIEEIESAFSIEKVTDEFFDQYKDLYVKLYEHFSRDNTLQNELINAGIDTARFTKKLLGQIVFLYFLQKKGWLGVPKNKTWGHGHKRFVQELFEITKDVQINFFKDALQYLFYEALAKERDNVNSYYERFSCRIPFLNGGLFEAEYNWREAEISIPEELFRNTEKNKSGDVGTGVLDVFDRYNFTIKEDEPLDKEVAVDPEMLGKVFENMLEITERKSKGAFYTPREIVHYMCQESLIHYLDNSLKDVLVPKADIEIFIRQGLLALENDKRVVNKGHETNDYKYILPASIRQYADLIDRKLTEIKICDPAIGSGAFPVGILHELVNAHLVLKPHLSKSYLDAKLNDLKEGKTDEDLSESRYVYRLKRHIIQESIYGVDIDASAIDIARLRLWLSLVVDEDDIEPIETLPNLDYKIVCGNSLIGMPENTMRNLDVQKELENLKKKFYNITNEYEKKQLRNQINAKIRELLDSAEQFAGYKIDFDYKLFFSEVWHTKGGFDIVFGNPPYNELRDLPIFDQHNLLNSQFIEYAKGGRINLFQFFYPLAIFLAKERGVISFITQNSILAEESAFKNRVHIFSSCSILQVDSFPERDNIKKRVFESAKMSVGILFLRKNRVISSELPFIIRVYKDKFMNDYHDLLIDINTIKIIFPNSLILPISNENSFKILLKIKSMPFPWYLNSSSGEIDMTKFKNQFKNIGKYRVVTGAQVQRFFLTDRPSQGEVLFLNESDLLISHAKKLSIKNKRIVLQRITGVDSKIRIIATIIDKNILCANSTNTIIENDCKINIYCVLGILNSEVVNFYFKQTSTNTNVTTTEINRIPFPLLSQENQNSISIIVHYLLFLNNAYGHNLLITFFESTLNTAAYEIYFSKEVQSAEKQILVNLVDLTPITETMSVEEKLAIVQSEFERLYDPNHPVRFAIETLDSIEEVRIIKEALK